MILIAITAIVLSLIVIGVHYEALRLASFALTRFGIKPRVRVACGVFCALVAHWVEVVIFAVAWGVLIGTGQATLEPSTAGTSDVIYFSLVCYTSLGFGDIVAVGPARLLAGVEALVGLVLIAWTASFSYMCMIRYWDGAHDMLD